MNRSSVRSRRREIARILAHNGFDWLWSKWRVGKVLGEVEVRPLKDADRTQAVRLRTTFEQLGTTFIKLGQMLSTRPDLLPADYIAELSKLQDDAPKVPYEQIETAVESEFEAKPEVLFKSFEKKPKAAASISQVHDAVLPDGRPVVVKVRRPGIEQVVEQDLAILGQLLRFLAQNTELGRQHDLEGTFEEFAYTLRNELDFALEGQNAERIAAQFADDDSIHVPEIFWQFSTHSVLTMEAISGIKIDDFAALEKAGLDRSELAKRCAHIALVQVLDNGFFHADPHPGNFFVQSDGVVALIDYGMVGRIDERLKASLLRLSLAVSRNDAERATDELLELGAARGRVDRRALTRDVERMLSEYQGISLGSISASKIFHEVSAIAQRFGLSLPSDLMVLARVAAMDEGLGAKLDPSFDLLEFARPYFERFWKRSHSPEAILGKVKAGAIDLAELAVDLPQRIRRLEGMLERGEVTLTSRIEVPDPLMKKLQSTANRIAISALTAGLIVGLSVVVLVYNTQAVGSVVRSILIVGLAAAILSGAWLAGSFWKSRR